MLNIYKIIEQTCVEGPGKRFCLWVQGCRKHCEGCFARDTWDFGIGKNYSVDAIFEKILSQQDIEGVTFLGGEPFEQAKELALLAKKIQSKGLSVVCFTGYTIEEIRLQNDVDKNKLLDNIDLLIDGGFEKDSFDLSRPWVGSSNQRYLFLTNFYKMEDILQYKNKIEARISQDGRVEFNGMGDFHKLNKNFCLQLGKNNVK
jgi:anaerobic ribonucleoside-triphosphate reductase activating protein